MKTKGNGVVRTTKRSGPKGDPWVAFDALPAPVRHQLWEGVNPLCPLKISNRLRKYVRSDGEADAIRQVMLDIRLAQAFAAQRRPPA